MTTMKKTYIYGSGTRMLARRREKERKNTTVGVKETGEELKSSLSRVKPPEVTIPQAVS